MDRYKIIKRSSSNDLQKKVNEYLNLGWRLVGGVALAHQPDYSGDNQSEKAAVFTPESSTDDKAQHCKAKRHCTKENN